MDEIKPIESGFDDPEVCETTDERKRRIEEEKAEKQQEIENDDKAL